MTGCLLLALLVAFRRLTSIIGLKLSRFALRDRSTKSQVFEIMYKDCLCKLS